MAFAVIRLDELEWQTRPSEPGEPRRHVAEVSDRAGFEHSRGNFWRYEPGARGRRHREVDQEETFVVIHGTLSMYLGDPPERHRVQAPGVVHVRPGTPLQTVNEEDDELLVYAYGVPPTHVRAEILDSAV